MLEVFSFLSVILCGAILAADNRPSCGVGSGIENGEVYDVDDGEYDRCFSLLLPPMEGRDKVPVLFWSHGAGGNAKNCGGQRAINDDFSVAQLADFYGIALVCLESLQKPAVNSPGWMIPQIITDKTGTPCSEDDTIETRYLESVMDKLDSRGTIDLTRIFFFGCSMGSAFTEYAASCYKMKQPSSISAFATHSTGLKVKGDGLNFPGDMYGGGPWGECDGCQYFPMKPLGYTDDLGLKACVFDNYGDNESFYNSSVNLVDTWQNLGNRVEYKWGEGGHCAINSFLDMMSCMDDGTKRLMSN